MVKVIYLGTEGLGEIVSNRSLTVAEAIYSLGYDVNSAEDCKKAYRDEFAAAYIADDATYQIDTENIELVY